MSNMVINVIHEPVSLVSWCPVCSAESGQQPPCRCGGGSSAASWDAREPETPQGHSKWRQGRGRGTFQALAERQAWSRRAPRWRQLCPVCPHICWEQSGTHFSSCSFACTAFPHGSPRGCQGRNGMTGFPGHSVPAGHAVPRDSPSVAHTHCPELLEGGPRPLLGTMDEW